MKLSTPADQASQSGPKAYFTGSVRLDNAFSFPEPGRTAAAIVSFAPGARTAWHTHPLGQLLYITEGEGWVQVDGQPKRTVRAGDTVFFEADERHWHGATATRAMTHVAVQEKRDGSPVDWQEQVSDADYAG